MKTGKKREFLERTVRESPEYEGVLFLFRELFAHIEGRENETGISFEMPASLSAERADAGIPLISPEGLRVDGERAARFLSGAVEAVRKASGGGNGALGKIVEALGGGGPDLAPLYRACLARDRKTVEEAARALDVPPPLLEFVLEIPLKTALERAADALDPSSVAGWNGGNCPVCGSRPGMDELVGEEGRRLLSCSTCFFKWPYKRLKCPYCGNEDPDSLSYFTAGDGPTRVAVCRKCGRYIKTRDSRKGNADVPIEAEDLATLHLDLLAGKEGFERGT